MTTLDPVDGFDQSNLLRRKASAAWDLAVLGGLLVAIDPSGFGGVRLQARPGAARQAWCTAVENWLTEGAQMITVPSHVTHEQLVGSLDIEETLRTKKPKVVRGAIERAYGGLLVLRGACGLDEDRLNPVLTVLESSELRSETCGLVRTVEVECGCVAFDEGRSSKSEPLCPRLADHLGMVLDLDMCAGAPLAIPEITSSRLDLARDELGFVQVDPSATNAICRA